MEDRREDGKREKREEGRDKAVLGLVMLLDTSPTPSARLPGLPYALIAG
jgi:hypothetical protein